MRALDPGIKPYHTKTLGTNHCYHTPTLALPAPFPASWPALASSFNTHSTAGSLMRVRHFQCHPRSYFFHFNLERQQITTVYKSK